MRLLFLDCDGVLNHDSSPEWETRRMDVLDEQCLLQLQRIVQATGCRIVVSSSWRFFEYGMRTLREALARLGMGDAIVGQTPYTLPGRFEWESGPRRQYIRQFLKDWAGEPVESYVVLDDATDADLRNGTFVRTFWSRGGLTQEKADRVIARLERQAGSATAGAKPGKPHGRVRTHRAKGKGTA